MKIYKSISEVLKNADPSKETFIVKNFFDFSLCEKVLNDIEGLANKYPPNIKICGDNWYYDVDKHDTKFRSYIFQDLKNLANANLLVSFKKIWEAYKVLGEDVGDSFDLHLGNMSNEKTINPLIFSYPSGTGQFDWHQHPPIWQKFQLLVNLTQPKIDYEGGFTHIEMANGAIEIFDHNFEKGDLFSFPYSNWHKVDPIFEGKLASRSSRVSLLMPLHPREKIETKIRNKDGLIY